MPIHLHGHVHGTLGVGLLVSLRGAHVDQDVLSGGDQFSCLLGLDGAQLLLVDQQVEALIPLGQGSDHMGGADALNRPDDNVEVSWKRLFTCEICPNVRVQRCLQAGASSNLGPDAC